MKFEFMGFKEAADVFVSGEGHGRLKKTDRDSITMGLLKINVRIVSDYNIMYIIFRKIEKDYINFNCHETVRILKIFYIKVFKRFNDFNANKNRGIVEVLSWL
jgi:hypothetical protein